MRKKRSRNYIFSDTLEMEEFCRAHFEEYHSTSSFGCNVTQLSTGLLETKTTCSPIQDVHLEIFKSNQTLLYEEEANTKSVSFCWLETLPTNNTESQTIISGHQMTRNSIAGFNRINKTGGNIWDIVGANEELCCMSLKWNKLQERINKLNAFNAYGRLEECIGIDSHDHASAQLKKLFNRHFNGHPSTKPNSFYDLAIIFLDNENNESTYDAHRCESTDLIEDMVKLIHEDRAGMPPITLDEITEYLNSKTESLNTICRKIFNMDVIELVRRVRLEQTRKAFLTPHSSTGLKEFTKKRTALYYGFKNWKKFEASYSTYFGESPSQTIDRSNKNLYSFSAWQGE